MKQVGIKGFSLRHYRNDNTQIAYHSLGPEGGPAILWGHGWGQNHIVFRSLAESLEPLGHHILVDFPGFGESPPPATAWGTEEYAEALATFIRRNAGGPVVLIGHSFGCRVGLQIAARHPELISGLFLIAAAGLRRHRPLHKKIYLKARVALFKTLKKLIPLGLINQERLYKTFGSSDYRNAGSLRQLFVKVVNEDLSDVAQKVNCPVILAYGTQDNETPVEMGERFNNLIKGSQLLRFEGLDHYSILGEGRHQLAPHIKKFIETYGRKNV